MAMACHVRLAAHGATFGLPEVKLGLLPGFGGTQRMTRIIGASRATELILSGDSIPAEQAAAWGLVNRVLPPAELLPRAMDLASRIAALGRPAVRAALQAIGAAYRRLLRRGRRMTLSGADGALHEQLTRLRLDHHLLPGARPPTTGSRPTTGT
jgi:enoyl-CoA hydratase/carnithine racemase